MKVPDDNSDDDDGGGGIQQQAVFKESTKLSSKMIQQRSLKTNKNKFSVFEASDVRNNSKLLLHRERQWTENYPTSTVIKKSAIDVNSYKPMEFNLNLISNSSVNRETKSDKSKIESKRIEELDGFKNVNRETATLSDLTTGISVFDQDADFDLAMEF